MTVKARPMPPGSRTRKRTGASAGLEGAALSMAALCGIGDDGQRRCRAPSRPAVRVEPPDVPRAQAGGNPKPSRRGGGGSQTLTAAPQSAVVSRSRSRFVRFLDFLLFFAHSARGPPLPNEGPLSFRIADIFQPLSGQQNVVCQLLANPRFCTR